MVSSMQIDGLHWIQIEHFTSAVLVLLNFKYGVSTLPVQHNHSTMPVAFYLSIDVRVTHVLNNALESFLFKRAQYGKIVFTAFTIKKVKCSKFTKYYFNKKKLLTLFQFISKSTFQHRCFSKNWYKRQMEVDVNLTQYHACLRLGVRPSPIWMAAELVNVTVSLLTRSCLVVQVIRQHVIRQHVIRQLHGTVNFFKKV